MKLAELLEGSSKQSRRAAAKHERRLAKAAYDEVANHWRQLNLPMGVGPRETIQIGSYVSLSKSTEADDDKIGAVFNISGRELDVRFKDGVKTVDIMDVMPHWGNPPSWLKGAT